MAAVSVLTGLALAAMGCDGGVYVQGIVQTSDAVPVPNAYIVLANSKGGRPFQTKTDAAGCFSTGGMVAPGRYGYNVIVVASGYDPAVAVIRTLNRNYATVTLRPEKAVPGSSATVIEIQLGDPSSSERPCTQR